MAGENAMCRRVALLIVLALALWGGTAAWLHQVLALQGPGMVWDFYPLWQ
nr:hypothetical protein [Anaerolineae bacterium]